VRQIDYILQAIDYRLSDDRISIDHYCALSWIRERVYQRLTSKFGRDGIERGTDEQNNA